MTRAQQQLRQDISRINKRLARLEAAGVSSPAAERLLTAVGSEDGRLRLPKGATLSQETAIRQAAKRFLSAETSTLRGYKAVEKKRLQGTVQAFRDRGFTGSTGDVQKTLQGAKSFAKIAEMFSIGSSTVQTEFIRGAQRGETSEQVMARLEQEYGDISEENDIEDIDK